MFKIPELIEATQGKLVCGSKGVIIKGVSIDSREVKRGEAFIAIKGDKFNGHDFIQEVIKKGASCIITQENPIDKKGAVFIRVKDTVKALGDIARFNRRRFDIPVIAVTGSNGKTTTKEMIAQVLSGRFKVLKNEGTKNNHIGLPLTLLNLDSSYDLAVLEIGTNHPGEVKYLGDIAQANVGVITNIGPSHLEYFKNLKGVYKEKYSLIRALKKPALGILNGDEVYLKKEARGNKKTPFILSVGIRNKSDFTATNVSNVFGALSFMVNNRFGFALNVLGYYNIYNALLAIAVAKVFGLDYRDIASRLSAFSLPTGRLNYIKIKNIRFIDDTYNSNPLSMGQALEVLKNFTGGRKKIFVMGDMLELGKIKASMHARLIKEALEFCDTLITVGELSKASLGKCSYGNKIVFACGTSREARDVLLNEVRVRPNDIILVKGSRAMKMEEVFNF